MGQLLLEAMQVGNQIATQRNQRLAQEEARRQRQAEAMALADYRREQLVNQARDDERAQRQAEALADYHKGQLLRQQQADIDAASNRAAIAEDRGFARDDRRVVANEKTAEQLALQQYQDAFQEGMATRDLSGIDLQDETVPLDQFGKPRTTIEAFDYAARKPGVRVPADMLEKRMTAEMMAERMAQAGTGYGRLSEAEAAEAAKIRAGLKGRAGSVKSEQREPTLQEYLKAQADYVSRRLAAWKKANEAKPAKERRDDDAGVLELQGEFRKANPRREEAESTTSRKRRFNLDTGELE